MFSNIMRGKNKLFTYLKPHNIIDDSFKIFKLYRRLLSDQPNVPLDIEITRFRKKPQHGTRHLIPSKLFEFNAWDDVPWDEEQEKLALEKVSANSKTKVSDTRINELERNADKYWDSFYNIHQNRFFKDRNWLFTEFPELDPSKVGPISVHSNVPATVKSMKIFEIGCGVGNTVFPILRQSSPELDLFIYASDFSTNAIDILKESPDYDEKKCCAFVLDATADDWNPPFEEGSLDIAVLIFALSAINPEKFEHIARQIYKYLAPGGLLLIRDYGRYDLAQLRFKDGQCLAEHFYARGDGTRVYFFTQGDMKNLFEKVGFVEEQNLVDRRLQVNRGKMLKMYRVWIQGKYRKPITTSPCISTTLTINQ